jgi:hypothetical protein
VVVYKGVFYHSGGRKINVSLVFYLFSRDGLMRCPPSPPQLLFDWGSEECWASYALPVLQSLLTSSLVVVSAEPISVLRGNAV